MRGPVISIATDPRTKHLVLVVHEDVAHFISDKLRVAVKLPARMV